MVATTAVWARVEAPPVVPHPFGLFSVAVPTSPASTDWQVGVQFQSFGCVFPRTTTDLCINGTTVAKTYDGCLTNQTAKPITVYTAYKRSGESFDVASAQASAALQSVEEHAVEIDLWARLGTAVTEGTAVAATEALAAVEALLADNYAGLGVIHMDRTNAIRVASALVRSGTQLTTIVGTPVVVGAGYEKSAIYGTGALVVYRGTIETLESGDLAHNDVFVIAERTYVTAWDCAAVGVNVT